MLIYDIRSVFFFITYLNGFEPLTNCLTGNCSTVELQVFNILIQPQIPLRLPCYDFTLITNPTMINNNNIVRKFNFLNNILHINVISIIIIFISYRPNFYSVTGGVYKPDYKFTVAF